MTKKQYIKVLRCFLLLMGVFIVLDALLHFTGIRTKNIERFTTKEIKSFINLFVYLWASAALLLGLIVFEIRKFLLKYIPLLDLFALFSIWHGTMLIILSFNNYENILPLASMYIWHPYYTFQLIFEGSSLIFFSLFYSYGKQKKYLD